MGEAPLLHGVPTRSRARIHMTDETYQQDILNASDTCSNCFARQRRDAIRPMNYDPDEIYSERIRAQTSMEDVPDTVVSEAGHLFCNCGANRHHTRIWDDADVDRSRLTDFIVQLLRTLDGKGYRVDARRTAEVARAWYESFRSPRVAPFEDPADYNSEWRRTPSSINEVLAAAVAEGVSERLEADATSVPAAP